MDANLQTLTPRQTFEDNMRPAHLLVQLYQLLDANDQIHTDGQVLNALRQVVGAGSEEYLLLINHELFLGLVRERAHLTPAQLRKSRLSNLLRQAVVASCTALETYLPALLRVNLPLMILARGRDAVPRGDPQLMEQFKTLTFTLDEALRIMTEPSPEIFISNQILTNVTGSYLSGTRGVAVTGKLLGLAQPWQEIAARLRRDSKDLAKTVDNTVSRRNDIVHRGDRSQSDPGGEQQPIEFSWTQSAVHAITDVCLALDELVAAQAAHMREMIEG